MIPAEPKIGRAIPPDKSEPLEAFIVIDATFKPDLLPIGFYSERLGTFQVVLDVKHLKGKISVNTHPDDPLVAIGSVEDTGPQGHKDRVLTATLDV